MEAFPYAWSVFFRLTRQERLDRLPQVFGWKHHQGLFDESLHRTKSPLRGSSTQFTYSVFKGGFLAWLNQ